MNDSTSGLPRTGVRGRGRALRATSGGSSRQRGATRGIGERETTQVGNTGSARI